MVEKPGKQDGGRFKFSDISLDRVWRPDKCYPRFLCLVGYVYRWIRVLYYLYSLGFDLYIIYYVPGPGKLLRTPDNKFLYALFVISTVCAIIADCFNVSVGLYMLKTDKVSLVFLNTFSRKFKTMTSYKVYCFLYRVWKKLTLYEKCSYIIMTLIKNKWENFLFNPLHAISLAGLVPNGIILREENGFFEGLVRLQLLLLFLKIVASFFSVILFYTVTCCSRSPVKLESFVLDAYERAIVKIVNGDNTVQVEAVAPQAVSKEEQVQP